ncbi:MAG: phosphoglucosamine mutase [Oscillospiraceae bacterium]|nr:phosphoglucosamine mutase [Oscillospiraceae bacterium]
MGKLFGTDGIRGIANETLDVKLAFRVGQAAAISLAKGKEKKPTVVIGMDTRISSDMLESAVTAGLTACGADVVRLGVVPTPAVAYLTIYLKADAGVVISASHNPFEHNGIKMFSNEGFKLNDELEAGIEDLILQEGDLPTKSRDGIGMIRDGKQYIDAYLDHLASTVEPLQNMRIVLDLANGASTATAKRLFDRFPGLDITYIHDAPNGTNINVDRGSTHLGSLAKTVREGKYDLGFAFDGDADRCLAVDENGEPVDGDQMMAACALYLQKQNKLPGGGFVATVMSNIGLHKFMKANDLKLLCAAVGDRNVLEMMQKEGMALGGEQSGHVIYLEHMPTGDGELTALQMLAIVQQSGKKLSELAALVTRYPQILINVAGPHANADKDAVCHCETVQSVVREAEKELGGDGRILLRPSGTEPLIRVMVEAATDEDAKRIAEKVAEAVKKAV